VNLFKDATYDQLNRMLEILESPRITRENALSLDFIAHWVTGGQPGESISTEETLHYWERILGGNNDSLQGKP
jgi:hypothetical protein